MKENVRFMIGIRRTCFLAVLFWVAQICISNGADPVPQSRRVAWQPGVIGGIPNRTTVFRTLTTANTLADINSAIASCPSNQVVYLAAGTYNLSGNILIRNNGVTLRGAGTGKTILVFNNYSWANVFFLGQDFNDPNTTQPNNLVNWTAGYSQGTTDITLSSTSGLSVGTLLMLDQLNDNVDVNGTGSEGCTYCGRLTGGRGQIQGVRVTGISGNTVSIPPGLYMPNWSSARSPQAWWFGTSLEMSGVEDLTVNNLTTGSQISMAFKNSRNCWAKNVESTSTLSSDHYHVKSYIASHIEVRHCYFKGVLNAPGSDHYGVDWFWGWDCLAEDNIFSGVTSPLVLEASSEGNVNGYNFLTNML